MAEERALTPDELVVLFRKTLRRKYEILEQLGTSIQDKDPSRLDQHRTRRTMRDELDQIDLTLKQIKTHLPSQEVERNMAEIEKEETQEKHARR